MGRPLAPAIEVDEAGGPPPDSVLGRLRSRIGIPEGQGPRAFRLLLLVFAMSWTLALLKATQSGVFLAVWPRSAIPWAFAASAATLASASAISVMALGRLGPIRVALVTLPLGAMALVADWVALAVDVPGAAFATYVIIEALAGLLIIQVWSVVSEVVDSRSARRLYPIAGLGGSLAWVLSGFAVPVLAALFTTRGLLLVAPMVLLVCTAVIAWVVRTDLGGSIPPGRRSGGLIAGWFEAAGSVAFTPLLRVGAALSVLALLIEQLMDLQLMSAAQAAFASDEASLASFFGVYYGVTSGIAMVALGGFSGRVFARLGASRALLLTPSATIALALGTVLVPGLAAAVVLRGTYRILKQSIWSAAMQQTLLPVPSIRRAQARALIRGVLAPGAYGVSALVLAGLGDVPLTTLGLVTVGLAGTALLVIVTGVRKSYLLALRRAIDDRTLDLDDDARTFGPNLDLDAVSALRAQLLDPDPHVAGLAAELLANAGAIATLMEGLDHPDDDIRAFVVDSLAELGAVSACERIGTLLSEDEDVDVRRACARALRRLRPEPSAFRDILDAAKDDADSQVRAWTKVTLMEGRPSEYRQIELMPMLEAKDPAERRAAATALTTGMVLRDGRMQRALISLLTDSDLPTRLAAIQSAARMKVPAMLPHVLQLLQDPATAGAVAATLPMWDSAALDALADWMQTAHADTARIVARSLARMPGADVFLLDLVAHADPQVRTQALRELVSAVCDGDRQPLPQAATQPLLEAEIALAWRFQSILAGVAHDDGTPDWAVEPEYAFLGGELERAVVYGRRRILSLLIATGRTRLLMALEAEERRSVRAADAQVAELLDVALGSIGKRIVPLFEPMTLRDTIDAARKLDTLDEAALDRPLQALADAEPHLRRCAMLCYGDRFARAYPQLWEDDAELMPLFERMRFLRSVPLFSELSGNDLRSVARILEQVDCSVGDVVVHKGETGEALYVIVEGTVTIRDGEVELAQIGPTEFFGELSVLDRAPRNADGVCDTPCTLLRLRGADLRELMARRPRIQEEVLRVVVRRLRDVTRRVRA